MRMSKAEFARYRGVTGAAVTKMVKTGRVVVGADGKIHRDTADNMLDGDVHVPDEKQHRDQGAPDLDVERARKMKADADLAELKVKEAEGRLIPLDVIKRADFATIRRWRDQLLGLADRISPKVAATTDERECNAIIDDETRTILNEMAAGVDYGRAADKASDE